MMVKRDLKADLELCNKATPGPWRHEWNPDYSEVYAPGFDNPIILVGHDPDDADFIVQAREGWPHAIERALEAEALVRVLVEALEEATWLLKGYAGRPEDIERLKKELVKAKEVLGDE